LLLAEAKRRIPGQPPRKPAEEPPPSPAEIPPQADVAPAAEAEPLPEFNPRVSDRRRPGSGKKRRDGTATGGPRTSEGYYATEKRYRPGEQPAPTTGPFELPDPNRAGSLKRVDLPAPDAPSDFLPVPDRWRLAKDLNLVKENWLDPYNRNLLKADRPFYHDWFFNLSLISDSTLEPRRLPTPVSPQTGLGRGALDNLGSQDQFLYSQNFIFSFITYKGDTVFRPPDYEFRITPVINYNYTEVDESRVLNIDPRRGATREDWHVGLQELFLDAHLRNVSDRYDFDSIRVGIQPFTTDFRGFLFLDNQLGIRLFGTRDNNLWQYNLAYFRRVEKDTNSGLNDIRQDIRDDEVFVANLYRQDFPVRGFTSQAAVVYNRNREGDTPGFSDGNPFADDDRYYDNNGFLARPSSLGLQKPRDYDVVYLGYNGDGHIGRFNLTGSFYYAIGEETPATFVNQTSDIRAWFAAAEGSMDFDWIRVRASVLYGSGDDDPYDTTSEGFDAIFENPAFAGADTSFWIRQAVPNINGGGVALSGRNGVLNSLRSSKEQGQSNFTNPGIELYGLGADFDILPELRLSTNFNKLFFADTAVLEAARTQGDIGRDIGWDLSMALTYRLFNTQNIVARVSGAVLAPGDGFSDLFGDEVSYSVLGNIVLTY
jgi:hypothetical protein